MHSFFLINRSLQRERIKTKVVIVNNDITENVINFPRVLVLKFPQTPKKKPCTNIDRSGNDTIISPAFLYLITRPLTFFWRFFMVFLKEKLSPRLIAHDVA